MGKSDKRRAQGKIDEQQKMSQSYLTGLQSQLGQQYGNYGGAMFGNAPNTTQNTFGWGTTTPHYAPGGYGNFPGSTTGNNDPYGQGQGSRNMPPGTDPTGQAQYRNGAPYPGAGAGGGPAGGAGGGQTFTREQVKSQLMPYLQSLGGASSETLEKALPEIQRMFPGARFDTSGGPKDEIVVPGVGVIDLIANAETGGPKSWTFQGGNGPGGAPGQGGGGGILGQAQADYGNIMKQYQNWADTGGLSEQDKANLRQRAVSPSRGIYARAGQELERNRSLQGGYSPGHTTALGRFAREQGQQASDAIGNAEANITGMTQQGKQFGMGGMTGMYGATPGMLNTVGNQMLQSMGQQLQAGGLQNQLSLGLAGIQTNPQMFQGFDYAKLIGSLGQAAGGIGTAIGAGRAPRVS